MRSIGTHPGRTRNCAPTGVIIFGATLALSACVPSDHLAGEQARSPDFDPIAFFFGHTRGSGGLKVVTKRRERTLVEGYGVLGRDGTLTLDPEVRRGNRVPARRTWQLRRVAPGRYAGTLTNAVGPVIGEVSGNRLHLSFTMKGGLRAQQWLYLQPGGEVAHNRMVVTKLGLPVASLDETITRKPD